MIDGVGEVARDDGRDERIARPLGSKIGTSSESDALWLLALDCVLAESGPVSKSACDLLIGVGGRARGGGNLGDDGSE